MVCCTVVQYTCLLINDAHHKYLQATLNLDSCLEIHCMPNPFGEKIKKDHYSNIIKLVSNILLEIAECDYIIQTSDHLVWKVYPLWAWCEKKNALLWFKFFISYFICWWGWVRPKPNPKFGPWAMIFEWPGLVYHGMLSMTPPSLEFFFQIRLYMVYLHLRLAIFLYQWHCWSIFTVKNHFSYSKIFFNVKCWKIGYQSNIWSVLVFMTLSCYATNLTLFRIYSGTDTKLFIIL